ncbi:unnamed protein product [Spirodela intermedia]|uniref:Uncharacterized protein n=1 Tax=Spirodela intermedia TaxID=51605 RepID=A0A7I8J3Y4_SPIIN|nr:unnamed protein product [Spirodela intermedia]CAA6664473.1 unnamed protein product [Spirodela intermedia]
MVNQEITVKADVYSFGMVLLELITGKSATGVSEGQWNHLIRWVEGKMKGRHGMDQMVDEGLNGDTTRCRRSWCSGSPCSA